MNIEIRNSDLQARIEKQMQATGSSSVEQLLIHLLETQEEQDRWLQENRDAVNNKIARGMNELNSGKGIAEDQLDAYLKNSKTTSK